jgi:molecular chaperone HscB
MVETDIRGTCIYCSAPPGEGHFCSECGRIQPVPAGIDYFRFLGLPRKLLLDDAALETTFYALSRRFHPDYFMSASDQERQASTERSSLLNDAYRTLREPVSRAQYLLRLEGYKEAEKTAPPDLLEEVFELNMQVEELRTARKHAAEDEMSRARGALEEAMVSLKQRLEELDHQLLALFEEWDLADYSEGNQASRSVLDRMSQLLSHRSYIHNLVRDIEEEL